MDNFVATQNQGEKNATKTDVSTIMREAIEEANKKLKLELHEEMKILNEDIVKDAHMYVDDINVKLKKQMLDIQSTLTLALTGMQQITGLASPSLMLKDLSNVEWPQPAKQKTSISYNTTLETYTGLDIVLYVGLHIVWYILLYIEYILV